MTAGGVVSLLTRTEIEALAVFPEVSLAMAVTVCPPLPTAAVFHD